MENGLKSCAIVGLARLLSNCARERPVYEESELVPGRCSALSLHMVSRSFMFLKCDIILNSYSAHSFRKHASFLPFAHVRNTSIWSQRLILKNWNSILSLWQTCSSWAYIIIATMNNIHWTLSKSGDVWPLCYEILEKPHSRIHALAHATRILIHY